jgi:hypothetical protein
MLVKQDDWSCCSVVVGSRIIAAGSIPHTHIAHTCLRLLLLLLLAAVAHIFNIMYTYSCLHAYGVSLHPFLILCSSSAV